MQEDYRICGIVGIIAKNKYGFWQSDMKIFKELLWADQLRGTDGTGAFSVDKEGSVSLVKKPISAWPFLEYHFKDFETSIFQGSRIIIGHNRAATKGNKIEENTHPFKEDKITLVHNGTLHSHKHIADTEVDSHAICHGINKKGYSNTLKELSGAFALVWYNQQNKRLYLVRNNERPLNIIETKNLFVISSEPGLGKWILERNKNEVIKTTELQPGKLVSFNLDDLSSFKEKEIELKKYVSQNSTNWKHTDTGTTSKTNYHTGGTKEPTYGDEITFYTVDVYNKSTSSGIIPCLSGLYEDDGTEIDITYEGKFGEFDYLKGLIENHEELKGIITQKREYYFEGKYVKEWIVRSLTMPAKEEEKKNNIIVIENKLSKNNTLLTPKDLVTLSKLSCDMCQGAININFIGNMIVDKQDELFETVYCHECTPVAEEWNL